jgi:hypothetical protein
LGDFLLEKGEAGDNMRMTPHPIDVCPARVRALLATGEEVVDVVGEGADAADVSDEALRAENAGLVEHLVEFHAADADEGAARALLV